MQHIFLTSVDILGFLPFVGKPAKELKVLYTPTAANPDKNKWYIGEDRRQLKAAGIRFTEFNLKDIDGQHFDKELEQILTGIDVVIVSGGNTFYLLQETVRTNFGYWVNKIVKKGVWYVGASAGAVLAGSTIEPIKFMDEMEKAPYLKTYKGLNLIDSVIIPHVESKTFEKSSKQSIEECKKNNLTYIALTNEQSILVEGDTKTIVTSSSVR